MALKKYDEFLVTLKKFKELGKSLSGISSFNEIRHQIFMDSYSQELDYYIHTGKFEKGVLLINEAEIYIEKSNREWDKVHTLVLYESFAKIYFGMSNFRKALFWINRVINDKDVEVIEDILCFSRIFNLIIHFELGNEDLLEYQVKSTYQFLYKRKRLYRFETIILNFIRKELSKLRTQQEIISAFMSLCKELIEISKDPFERRALKYFDVISWLESRIRRKPFAAIVKEKA